MKQRTISIIGAGPRGLSALESLYKYYSRSSEKIRVTTLLFERTGHFGSGQVYANHQTLHNWLNISERALTIPERPEIKGNGIHIERFPSFHEWIEYKDSDIDAIDIFPSRAIMGRYLNERFASIERGLKNQNFLTTRVGLVSEVRYINDKFTITTNNAQAYKSDEVVLTIGHQPTYDSEQIKKWEDFAENKSNITLFTKPYPIDNILKQNIIGSNSKVALRGFGLAMIDVVRSIAGYTGGKFKILSPETQDMEFVKGENFPKHIFPFSLDGLPMAPKPINKRIDEWFVPKDIQLSTLKETISLSNSKADTINSNNFLIEAITPIIVDIYLALGSKAIQHEYTHEELSGFTKTWIKTGISKAHICLPENLTAEAIITHYVGMATGTHPISLDYCIGQVWRHCHPTLYECLSYTNFSEDVIGELIQLDNKLKRLTFGPPLASMQQLLAMIKSGSLKLIVVEDPDIQCTEKGWNLDVNDKEATVNIMINTVLDAPKILEVKSNIIKCLLEDDYIQPIHSKLGIETHKNGIVISSDKTKELPLALLGRLAKGTLFGVDAVLECFNQRSDNWAKDAVKRMEKSIVE